MKRYISLIIILSFSRFTFADPFGGDLALLTDIAVSTAKELKTTLELLEVSKKTQDNIKAANAQISMHRETMDRIERLATRARKISRMRIDSHSDLNDELSRIRSTISGSKRLSRDFEKKYGRDLEKIRITEERNNSIKESSILPVVTEKMVDRRMDVSSSSTTQATSQLNTAVNTAMTNQILQEYASKQYLVNQEQLEFFKEQRLRNIQLENENYQSKKFIMGN